ncbi:hypothetical protein FQZ97_1034490 [compost metagenome]
MQRQYAQFGGEARGFVLPVGDQAGRHDDQRRSVQASGLLLAEDMRQGLQGFAQAHVVGQHATDLEFAKRLHPGQAVQLVGAQLGLQALRWFDVLRALGLQALGKATQVFATLPVQLWALLQRVQPRGVGTRQAQALAGLARLAKKQLAQGSQQRLEASEGQGDAPRAVRQVDQQNLFILALGQRVAAEQPGSAANRLYQDR